MHTELTPSKLVFGDDRRLRIVDFGLARLLGEHDWAEPATVATHVARYASPEQAQGQPIDGKTDVYSLALILVEAVTGTVPFAARSTVATLSARIGKLMPVSADLGPLASVLERAGRPEPADRSSAAEFGRGLVKAAEKLPRPTPIPIVVAGPFADDPNRLRRPNDPTGGIARPEARRRRAPPPIVDVDGRRAGRCTPTPEEHGGRRPLIAAAAAAGAAASAAAAAFVDADAASAGAASGGRRTCRCRRRRAGRPSSPRPRNRRPTPIPTATIAELAALGQPVAGDARRPPPAAPSVLPATIDDERRRRRRRRRWLPWLSAVLVLLALGGAGYLACGCSRSPPTPSPS